MKDLLHKPDNPSSAPSTHTVEGENRPTTGFPQLPHEDPTVCRVIHTHLCIHKL